MAWLLRLDADVDYLVDLLPGLLVFSVGLSMTVAPLTATVLADADDSNAGIASGVNNAIARVAGLVTIAAVGAVVAASFGSRLDSELGDVAAARPKVAAAVEQAKSQPLAAVEVQGVPEDVQASVREAGTDASVGAFRVGIGIATVLVALGGVLGLLGVRNPRRRVEASECPAGSWSGNRATEPASPCDWDAGMVAEVSARPRCAGRNRDVQPPRPQADRISWVSPWRSGTGSGWSCPGGWRARSSRCGVVVPGWRTALKECSAALATGGARRCGAGWRVSSSAAPAMRAAARATRAIATGPGRGSRRRSRSSKKAKPQLPQRAAWGGVSAPQ